jgi:hypothetical protein
MKNEILMKFETIALDRTTPFCYGCNIKAPTGTCSICHSDDLMRHLEGIGVEYGTNWVIKYIIETEFTPVMIDQVFEESIRSDYPETTQVGWMTFDTIDLMKSNDPVSWKIARDEYIEELENDEQIITLDNGENYYWKYDFNSFKLSVH